MSFGGWAAASPAMCTAPSAILASYSVCWRRACFLAKLLIFLLGGARRGKCRYADQWARKHDECALFAATTEARDADMCQRIAERADEVLLLVAGLT